MLEAWKDLADTGRVEEVDDGFQLVASRCDVCDDVAFPATQFCRRCLSRQVHSNFIDPAGQLYAFSTIHTVDPVYTVGYVDLPTGLRVFGRVVGDVSIGDAVTLVSATLPLTFGRMES